MTFILLLISKISTEDGGLHPLNSHLGWLMGLSPPCPSLLQHWLFPILYDGTERGNKENDVVMNDWNRFVESLDFIEDRIILYDKIHFPITNL